jgi:hypothetical protein
MKKMSYRVAGMAVAASLLAGCGAMRSYDSEMTEQINRLKTGQVDLALISLEQNNTDAEKDLLYFFEKGEMLRMKANYDKSRDAWLKADEKIRVWEEDAKSDPEKLLKSVASVVVNDKTRRYDGYDYEKVLLSTRLAMNHISLGDWNAARVEIKKTHEREAIIKDINSKRYAREEAEAAKNRGTQSNFKTLKGYPVETLDDPDVVSLKNAYQNPFSHYLAGFVYEALGEPGPAAAGYRTAIELRPNTKVLEEGLAGLDGRVSLSRRSTDTDVLFVADLGTAPARQSVQLGIPVMTRGGMMYTQVSFPVIRPDRSVYLPPAVTVNGKFNVALTPVANIDAMSRRTLRDDMPGIMLRTIVRATTRAIAQKEIQDRAGGLAGLAVMVATAVTEKADERGWRTLPAHVSIGRARLPQGKHQVIVSTPTGQQVIEVEIKGKYAVVPLRMVGSRVYGPQGAGGVTVPASSPAPAPAPTAAPAPVSAAPAVSDVASAAPATVSVASVASSSEPEPAPVSAAPVSASSVTSAPAPYSGGVTVFRK